MQFYGLCRRHLHRQLSAIHLLPLWRTWSNNLCNKNTKYSYYDTMRAIDQRPSSSQKSRTHSLPGFRRESNNPRTKKQEWKPGFQVPSSSFRTCWISGVGLPRRVICHSSSAGGAAVYVGTHAVCSSGWMVAPHRSSLCHWRAFCFTRNTGLLHSAQWHCSQSPPP